MKKLLTTTAFIVSLATSAFAGWVGPPEWQVGGDINFPLGSWYSGADAIDMGCVFTGTNRGTMVYDEDEAEWYIPHLSQSAMVQVEHRGIQSLTIESTGNIWRGGNETHARSEVDYTGSFGTTVDADGDLFLPSNFDDGQLDFGFFSDHMNHIVWQTMLYIGGKATMVNGSDDLLSGKSNYNIRHTVTCMM